MLEECIIYITVISIAAFFKLFFYSVEAPFENF